MMTDMVGVAGVVLPVLAVFDRPSNGSLTLIVLIAVAGWAAHVWAEWSTRPPGVEPGPPRRPEPLDGAVIERPAVVGLLTNRYDAPRTAVTATVLDLAARGWVRFSTVDGELVVVTRTTAAQGDSLRPFEQQVLNHVSSRAFNDVISAGTLAASHARLDRRWWLRFGRSVAEAAQAAGLSVRRYTPVQLAPPAVAVVIGLLLAWTSARGGDEVAIDDSWRARSVWVIAILALLGLGWCTTMRGLGSAQRPTDLGAERTAAWMGFRARLGDRIPPTASVIGSPDQQVALSQAVVMGVAPQVLDELPAAPEDHRLAWSEAGGTPHVVGVRYPVRPGYGQHPLKVGVAGVIVLLLARWLQSYLRRIADGDALESLLDRIPGQVDLIETIAGVLAVVCWIPIVWAAWAVVAGAVDSIATRERIGAVVRARRPIEVLPPRLVTVIKPFAERDRFSTYIAVDDGRRNSVTAWLASERSAAPQGAQARVRATPLLGYVRSSEPVGTATRTEP